MPKKQHMNLHTLSTGLTDGHINLFIKLVLSMNASPTPMVVLVAYIARSLFLLIRVCALLRPLGLIMDIALFLSFVFALLFCLD